MTVLLTPLSEWRCAVARTATGSAAAFEILSSRLQYVKGYYQRPIVEGGVLKEGGGGRVTELVARPLINLFYPALSGMIQPLSGTMLPPSATQTQFEWTAAITVMNAPPTPVRQKNGSLRGLCGGISSIEPIFYHNHGHGPRRRLMPEFLPRRRSSPGR